MAKVPQLSYHYITHIDDTLGIIVRIQIIDSATGNPTNGDYLEVFYTETLNGVSTNKSVQVPGQSIIIYNGDYNLDTDSWVLTSSVTPQTPPPPVGSCDLFIDNIVINNPESSAGANDGSLKVNATSSYGPILYSLNNTTFQASPIFNGLSGGLKTIYVTDSNPVGCTNQQSITIPTVASLLVSDPSVTIGANVSRWNAAFNPIVFTYQRKDFTISAAALYNTGGVTGTTLTVNGDMSVLVALAAAKVIAGANATSFYVYVNTGAYKGVYSVITATTSTVTIAATFTTTSTGFLNSDNIRPYYKIITQIQLTDPVTGQQSIVNSFNRSSQAGEVKANLSSYLQSLVKAVSNSNYQQVNYRDDNLSASYRIAYAESWDNGTDAGHVSTYVQLSSTYYVTYSARQLGQKYGGNLAEFVPFPTSASRWLTDFSTPAYSLTFPFDLSFIYSEALAGLQLYYKVTPLDINQNPIQGMVALTGYLLNEDGSYLLNTDGSRLIISQTSLTATPIVEHVGLNRLLIDYSFDQVVYYFKIGIYYKNGSNVAIQVVNDQTVRIDKNCDYNSVYLRWVGLTGSWNYYRFIYNQEHTLDVQNATIIQKYVSDWENQESIEEVISKSAGQKIQVHAEDMTISDIKGCQSMKYSPKVQALMSKSPIKWQTVVLNTATFSEYSSDSPTNQFAVTFNLPSINVQSQ